MALTRLLVSLTSSAAADLTNVSRNFATTAVLERNRRRVPFFYKPPKYIKKLVKYDGPYTTDPLPMERFGGRDEEGHLHSRRGGGDKRKYYMMDLRRYGHSDGSPLSERVLEIVEDMNRSANIALVAAGEKKRYIIATENMKPGDLITTYTDIPRTPVKPAEGDAHPLGALPVGTVVNSVQKFPGMDYKGKIATAAGVGAQLVKKTDGRAVLRFPSKREFSVSEECIATVGRVSNMDHHKQQYGKAGAKRWAGYRPRSGWWQRKDARFGRKPKKTRTMVEFTAPQTSPCGTYILDVPHGSFPCGPRSTNKETRKLIKHTPVYV